MALFDEYKLVGALADAVDRLPSRQQVLARFLAIDAIAPRFTEKIPSPLNIEDPPKMLAESRVMQGLMVRVIQRAGLTEHFMVQSVAYAVLDSLRAYFPQDYLIAQIDLEEFTRAEGLGNLASIYYG